MPKKKRKKKKLINNNKRKQEYPLSLCDVTDDQMPKK